MIFLYLNGAFLGIVILARFLMWLSDRIPDDGRFRIAFIFVILNLIAGIVLAIQKLTTL